MFPFVSVTDIDNHDWSPGGDAVHLKLSQQQSASFVTGDKYGSLSGERGDNLCWKRTSKQES